MAIDRRAKWIGGGVLAAAAAGVAAIWLTRRDTPPSTLILKDGAIEVRAYDALQTLETTRPGLRDVAIAEALEALLGHLSDVPHDGILMPILFDPHGGGWRTRIVLHGEARPPEAPDGIDIATLPARRIAAIRFYGTPLDQVIARQEARLRKWLEGYGLKIEGPWELATYSRPGVPGALQRHELLFPVASLY